MQIIQAKTRTNDPETSHMAAASITDLLQTQKAVLYVLRMYGPQNYEQLIQNYHKVYRSGRVQDFPMQSDSGIRSRCKALRDMGFVADTGQSSRLKSGRSAKIWRCTGK